jgi:hypothetical protein
MHKELIYFKSVCNFVISMLGTIKNHKYLLSLKKIIINQLIMKHLGNKISKMKFNNNMNFNMIKLNKIYQKYFP